MKKLLFFVFGLLSAVVVMGQQPVLTMISPDTHDFGKIQEADGRVSTVFEFKNEGMTPLVLSNVRASCGCTTPKWTREPVEPGQTGQITVTYNPNGRPGRFQKTVTITSNASEPTKRVYIKGEVIPKQAKPVDNYPVKMGDLSLKSQTIAFGTVNKGDKKNLEIEYANQTDHVVTVDVVTAYEDGYLKCGATLTSVNPKETGKIQVLLASDECPLYGPVNTKVFLIINGKQESANAITVTANIKEDFSQLTTEQLQLSPIVETVEYVDFGHVKSGKKLTGKIVFSNAGVNPLLVRRVIVEAPGLKVTTPKAIKGGKKGEIRFDVTTMVKGEEPIAAGAYTRDVTIITNDPKRSIVHVRISWTID